jgi:chemotaxis protein methyltransferase CheR
METSHLAETIVISDEELKSLTDAIHHRHGIDFSCYEPKSLKRRVARTLHVFKLNAVHELWIKILKDPSFIYPFMDEISVGLTSMFRDPILWRAMHHLLNEIFKEKKELSIWHAGCSTGEEVYTMGIVLKESGYTNTVKALATDISNQAMSVAKKGVFNMLKLGEYEQNYVQYNPSSSLKKYYTASNDTIRMDIKLISHVSFEHHNLIADPFNRAFDIIFCRNVMIYFDNNAKRKLFEKFYNALNPGGLLVIGFYDAVLPLVDESKFKVLDMNAKIYQKIQSL